MATINQSTWKMETEATVPYKTVNNHVRKLSTPFISTNGHVNGVVNGDKDGATDHNQLQKQQTHQQQQQQRLRKISTNSLMKLISTPNVIIEEKTEPVHQKKPKQQPYLRSSTSWTIDDNKYEKVNHLKYEKFALDQESERALQQGKAICGRTGTIRGVKNKVRTTLASLHYTNSHFAKQERLNSELGRIVVYITSNGIVRQTYHKCLRVKTILATLLVPFEERNVFIQSHHLQELRSRLKTDRYSYFQHAQLQWEDEQSEEDIAQESTVIVPQVFIDGRHLGGAVRVEGLNESGLLKSILLPYKSSAAIKVCEYCGNYRVQVCKNCMGSKKSPCLNNYNMRNAVMLRCTNCDENGLVPCKACTY